MSVTGNWKAAKVKGSPPLPPVPEGMCATKTHSTVTAYKDTISKSQN
jgi:hypothetical protein